MALPTILADPNLQGVEGSTQRAFVEPNFGVQLGIQQLSNAVEGAGNLVSEEIGKAKLVKQHKQNADNYDWAIEQSSKLKKFYSDFARDNKDKPTFAQDFNDSAKSAIEDAVAQAPNPDSARIFRNHALPWHAATYDEFSKINVATDQANAVASIDTNLQNARDAYTADTGTSPEYARGILDSWRQDQTTAIDQRWSAISPKTAQALREHVDTQVAQIAMAQNPAYADEIIKTSRNLTEEKRFALQNRLEEVDSENRRVLQDKMHTAWKEDLTVSSANGARISPPSDEHLKLAYGKNWPLAAESYRKDAETHNLGVDLIQKLTPFNPQYQQQALDEELKTRSTPPEVVQYVAHQLSEVQDLAKKDPALWTSTVNPDVKLAFQLAMDGTSNATPELLTRARDLRLRYQGAPPSDASPEDAAKYLGLPSGMRHVMTHAEAVQSAAQITKSGPNGMMAQFQSLKMGYPDANQWAHAYADMASLPDGQGIPQEIQTAILIDNPVTQQHYLSAIANSKSLEKIDPTTLKDLSSKVFSTSEFKQFSSAMVGPLAQYADSVEGFKSGITKYAVTLQAEGLTQSDAIKRAVKEVITDNGGTIDVNGKLLWIPKDRGESPGLYGPHNTRRSDGEIQDLGRRMKLELDRLRPDWVQTTQMGVDIFPTLSAMDKKSPEYAGMVKQAIRGSGYFVPEPHGQSATLWLKGDNGVPIQLRDIYGDPFEIAYDQIQTYTTPGPDRNRVQVIPGAMGWVPPQDVSKMPYSPQGGILEYLGSQYSEASGLGKTNWPTSDAWILQKSRERSLKLDVKPVHQIPKPEAPNFSPQESGRVYYTP